MLNKEMMMPKDKFDLDTCKNFYDLTDEAFLEIAPELLTWLQDGNWPIFPEIIKVFTLKQDIVIDEISKIFDTSDVIWQYWILSELYPNLSEKNKLFLKEGLKRCSNKLSLKVKKDDDEINLLEMLDLILN
ncbi:DUF5071 domain-containing protein [Treponema sp. OMZ 788]|uniref:DUF5071 domain-containing protein n=1 Tax=Treponema sp. OMZ 788 TaxID=2563664 RepID=UPI0020A24580|nr:DUF5071 domain-containing protein [Treponema sp. OMZ 788]UTC64614.1 DUF5071 domain-containing protein [Treponema sp. OMZ 788]